jgi:hypothetical protein
VVSLARLPPAAVVLIAFVLATQLAFTGIGQEIGPHWSEPRTLETADGPSAELVDLATTAGVDASASGRDGRVAWIVAEAGEYRVRLANVSARGGTLELGAPRTLARTDQRLASVDVARESDSTAVVWKRYEANEVVLARDNGTRTVSANESIRVNNPSVALVNGTPVVAYQEYASSTSSWRGVLATVSSNVSYSRFGEGTGPESVSPAVGAGPGGAVVAWVDSEETVAKTAPLSGDADKGFVAGEATVIGESRTLRSMSGTGQLAEVQLAVGGNRPVLLWTDLGRVNAVRLGTDGQPRGEPTALGQGQNPGFAAAEGRWLAATLVSDRSSGIDVRYSLARGDAVETGTLSALPSSAVHADAAFAPEPVVTWTETGREKRLLVSAYRPEGESGPVRRMQATPLRFLFLGVTALVIGAVTLPMMPWVAAPLLVGFFVTTRLALGPITRLGSWLSGLVGRNASSPELRRGIQSLPGWQPALVFIAIDTALLATILGGTGSNIAGVQFSNPVGVSLLAVPATAAVAVLVDATSPWKLAGLYGYLQTVGLWATAVPLFL